MGIPYPSRMDSPTMSSRHAVWTAHVDAELPSVLGR